MKHQLILLISLIMITSCSDHDLKMREKSITVDDIAEIVKNLGSDEFMGRKPFTPGEKITIDYLAGELKKIGFEPAFNDSYFQPGPMRSEKRFRD